MVRGTLFLLAVRALAQTGTVSGTVVDLSSEPVGGAVVQFLNTATMSAVRATSSKAGSYSISLPPGIYDVSANVPGFDPYTKTGISVSGDLRLELRLTDRQFGTLGDGRPEAEALLVAHATPSGPAPRTADGKPDFSGMWYPFRVIDAGKPEFLPWAAALFEKRTRENTKDAPNAKCLPRSAALMGGVYPFKWVQTPAEMILLFEDWVPSHREIFLDGRAHPKDLYTWLGHSVGHWEGDTLVVDRVGFNNEGWLENAGHPQTDKLHLIERFRRVDRGHLEVEMLIDDPGTFARPWTLKGVYDAAPEEELREFICDENNTDVNHMVGK